MRCKCRYDIKIKKQKLKYTSEAEERKETQKVSPRSKWEANTKLPSQMSKCRVIKGFDQNVSKLPVGINMEKIDVPFLITILEKVKAKACHNIIMYTKNILVI
jgi:hypothetical protein